MEDQKEKDQLTGASPLILGISCFYHDSSAALLKGTEIIAAAQEERFSRKKFDKSFPVESILFCLDQAKVNIKDIDIIAFYEDPILKWDRIYKTNLTYSRRLNINKLYKWFDSKLRVEDEIYKNLKDYKGKILISQHHLSHAASAFYPSPFNESTILVLDGIGEWACTTIGKGINNRIELIAEQRFPNSLGFLYSAFTQYLGFKVDSGEYKVMGLAPYGKAIYSELIKGKLISINDNGVLEINTDYFDFMTGKSMINSKFEDLFGNKKRLKDTVLNKFHFDIAASIQEVTEEIVEKIAKFAVNMTGSKNLVMAGGVALNCVSNGNLIRKGIVDKIWIQPCAGDGGTSLGAAFLAAYNFYDLNRIINKNDDQKGSYLGPSFSNEKIEKVLKTFDFKYERYEKKSELVDVITEKIIEGNVVGLFQGRMEYGPRALGARSIIADPRNSSMQEILNLKIKFRESFRPFAPIVLEEKSSEWFEKISKSPYMLLTTKVKDIKMKKLEQGIEGFDLLKSVISEIPSVTHVNGSARIQTVNEFQNEYIYEILKNFNLKTGCPILINTSFNIRGEPIVCSPYDALSCFMNTNMDFLVMEDFILNKKSQNKQLVREEFLDYLKND